MSAAISFSAPSIDWLSPAMGWAMLGDLLGVPAPVPPERPSGIVPRSRPAFTTQHGARRFRIRPAFILVPKWYTQWRGDPLLKLRAEFAARHPPEPAITHWSRPACPCSHCASHIEVDDVVDEPRRPLGFGEYGARLPHEPSRYGRLPTAPYDPPVYGPKPGAPRPVPSGDAAPPRTTAERQREAEHYSACKRAVRIACSKMRLRPEDRFDLVHVLGVELLLKCRKDGEPRDLDAWLCDVAFKRVKNFLRDEATRLRLREEDMKGAYRKTGPNWRPKWYEPCKGAVQSTWLSYGKGGLMMHCKGSQVGGPAHENGRDPAPRPDCPIDVDGLLGDAIDEWRPGDSVGPGDVGKHRRK